MLLRPIWMWPLRFQYKYIHGKLTYLLLILYVRYSDKTGMVHNKSGEQKRKTDRQISKIAVTIPSKSIVW